MTLRVAIVFIDPIMPKRDTQGWGCEHDLRMFPSSLGNTTRYDGFFGSVGMVLFRLSISKR